MKHRANRLQLTNHFKEILMSSINILFFGYVFSVAFAQSVSLRTHRGDVFSYSPFLLITAMSISSILGAVLIVAGKRLKIAIRLYRMSEITGFLLVPFLLIAYLKHGIDYTLMRIWILIAILFMAMWINFCKRCFRQYSGI